MVSFEEQVALIRESLAAQLESEEAFAEAAGVLAGIDLESGGWVGWALLLPRVDRARQSS